MTPAELIDCVLLSLGSRMRLYRRAGVENEAAECLRLLLAQLKAQADRLSPDALFRCMRQVSAAIEREDYGAALKAAESLAVR